MNLRAKALQGGAYLFLRMGLGVAISAVGIILLTRTIGPEAYGLYGAAFGIYTYLSDLCRWGVEVYLIRREEEPQPQDYHQAFSLLLLLSIAGAGSAFLALPLLERWIGLGGFTPIAAALFVGLPTTLLSLVPLARLEQALDYRKIALIEFSGQISYYLMALPLAYRGLGAWSPVGGWWAQQLLTLSLLYWLSTYRPRLYWEKARVRSIVKYGLGYSASVWVWHLRSLVNPLVVGRYVGAEAVGYIALAIRIVEQLGFAKAVSWRLSIAVLARVQGSQAQLVKAVTEGMSLQIMAVGPLLAGFGWAAPWIFPLLFGSLWLPVLEVYPFIALSFLSTAMFILHSSALYVLRRNWKVTFFHVLHIALFAGSALLLVPRLGLVGYGWAEVVAFPSYILLLIWLTLYVGRLRYTGAGIWFVASVIPLFSWQLGPWAGITIIVPLIWPTTRRELLQTVAIFWRTIRGH